MSSYREPFGGYFGPVLRSVHDLRFKAQSLRVAVNPLGRAAADRDLARSLQTLAVEIDRLLFLGLPIPERYPCGGPRGWEFDARKTLDAAKSYSNDLAEASRSYPQRPAFDEPGVGTREGRAAATAKYVRDRSEAGRRVGQSEADLNGVANRLFALQQWVFPQRIVPRRTPDSRPVAAVSPTAERVESPTRSDAADADVILSQLNVKQKDILLTLLRMNAVGESKRQLLPIVVEKINRLHTREDYAHESGELKSRWQLTDSRPSRAGGVWLTSKGKKIAERLREEEQGDRGAG